MAFKPRRSVSALSAMGFVLAKNYPARGEA